MTLNPSPATRKLSIRFGAAAVLSGMVLTAAPLTTAIATPSAPQAATTATNDEKPVAEVVAENTNMDGVKGKFVNRTGSTITAQVESSLRGEISGKITLAPGKFFTYTTGNKDGTPSNKTVIKYDSRGSSHNVVLHDRFSEYPVSDIDGVTWSHKQGELNRADRAPFDVSVKREADGNSSPAIAGENDDTEDWANMNVFVDDHDATVTSIDGTVKNNTGKNLVVQAFRNDRATSPKMPLKPDAQHRFDFAGTGNTIRVFNPSTSKSKPVQILTYDCPSRLAYGKVTSTYGDVKTMKAKTLVSDKDLTVHGGATHLDDGTVVRTHIDRPAELRDPNLRSNSTSNVVISLFDIPTYSM